MSKEQNKNYGKSIRTKLLNVARKENVFNQTILTRYFQERLLYRISQTHYRGNFYLKGGALMYAYEKFAARPTLDIDGLLHLHHLRQSLSPPYRHSPDLESSHRYHPIGVESLLHIFLFQTSLTHVGKAQVNCFSFFQHKKYC